MLKYISRARAYICYGITLVGSLLMEVSHAHEPWLMTSHQLKILKEQQGSPLFNSINIVNVTLILVALVGLMLIHFLYFYQKNIFTLQYAEKIKLAFGQYVSDILRFTTAGSLFIAAFGLIPQRGCSMFTPTLLLPDIHINVMAYAWIKWLEILLAVGLLIGIYIRLQGVLLIALTLFAYYLYPQNMWLYAWYFFAIGLYFLLEGNGRASVVPSVSSKCMMQVLTGVAFILSGSYKLLYPNVDIYLLTQNNSFTFFIPYDVFTLLMAIVEMSVGILILTGPFLRIITLLLFSFFIYLSIILNENILVHLFIYGILAAFIINGSYNE